MANMNITIGKLREVSDLHDGQRAYSEKHLEYVIALDHDQDVAATVDFVYRQGDRLIAVTRDGDEYAISGSNAYTIKTIYAYLMRP